MAFQNKDAEHQIFPILNGNYNFIFLKSLAVIL